MYTLSIQCWKCWE